MWPPPGHPAWRNKGVVGQLQRQGAPPDGSRCKKKTARNQASDMKKAVLRTRHVVPEENAGQQACRSCFKARNWAEAHVKTQSWLLGRKQRSLVVLRQRPQTRNKVDSHLDLVGGHGDGLVLAPGAGFSPLANRSSVNEASFQSFGHKAPSVGSHLACPGRLPLCNASHCWNGYPPSTCVRSKVDCQGKMLANVTVLLLECTGSRPAILRMKAHYKQGENQKRATDV
jgi:hypothetical protein